MRPIESHVAWSVTLSVCLSVCHSVSLCVCVSVGHEREPNKNG